MKNSNLIKRLRTDSHEKQTPQRFGRYAAMLIMLLTLGVGQMWADQNINKAYLKASFNGSPVLWDGESDEYTYNGSGHSDYDLGTLTGDFILTYVSWRAYANWGQNTDFYLYYNKDGNGSSFPNNIKQNWVTTGNPGDYYPKTSGLSHTVASVTDGSGNYDFEHYFYADFGGYGGDNRSWLSNGGNNYHFTYTILPPNVSSFAVSTTGSSTILSGDGSEGNPYLISYNGSLKLTISGSKEHTDANSDAQYNTAGTWNTTTTRTISNITSGDIASVTVKMRYHNGTASLDGAESSKTIYYKAKSEGFESSLNGIKYVTTGDPVEWSFNGKTAQTQDLSTVTNLYLKEWFTYEYQNWDGCKENTKFQYNIHRTAVAAGDYTDIAKNWKWSDSWSSGWQHWKFGNNSQNLNLLSGLGSGKYTMSFIYNDPDLGIISPVHSLKWTIGVPPATSITVTSDGTGNGTSGNPFSVAEGSNLTLTVTASRATDDDTNSELEVSFDNGSSWSTTNTLEVTPTTTPQSKTIKVRYHNKVAADALYSSVAGDQTFTAYYVATVTPSIAVTSIQRGGVAVTNANADETVTINASRQNAGEATITYWYKQGSGSWTQIGDATTATSKSWTIPHVTATTSFQVKATMVYDNVSYEGTRNLSVYGKKTIKVKNTNNWSPFAIFLGAGDVTNVYPGNTTNISAVGTSAQWKEVVLYSSTTNFRFTHGETTVTADANRTAEKTFASMTDEGCYAVASGSGNNLALNSSDCPEAPSVTTGSVSVKNLTSLTFTATGVADNRDAITTYGFKYGTTSECSDGDVSATNLSSGSFSKQVTGLSVGTKYYYQAYATNGQGTTYGSVQNATTTLATLSLAGTADYTAKMITITPTHNVNSTNGYSGDFVICCECTSKPEGAGAPTISWNNTTKKFDISGTTVAGDYTFNVKVKQGLSCSGDVFNNADKNITITMKDFVDLSGLTINHTVYNGTYMNGNGASDNPYFIYLSNAASYGKLNLSATLAAALSDGEIYYSVGGSEIGAVSVDGTAASVTMDLPNKTVGAGRSTEIKFYHKLDGQTAPNAKRGRKTVYYTVNTDPVVTVSATYNGSPIVGTIPQNADITVSATVTQIPGEPTFTYSKGSGAYTSETTYTLDAAGTTTMHAKTTYLGDWIGNLDVTTYAANSVTLKTRKTDMYGDESESSSPHLFSNVGESYTAPDIEGYTFSDWSCSNSSVQVSDDSGANWKSTSTNQTVYVKATSTGATLTAHYVEKKRIYFDNRNAKWDGDIYVYIFNGNAWYNDYNSSDDNGPGVVTRLNCVEDGKMTRIGESDVYYYEYEYGSSFTNVAFSLGNQHDYSHLYDTKGVWRTDFKTCNPCYVAPETSDQTKYDHGNGYSTYYYNNGYWRRYMPQYAPYSFYITGSSPNRTLSGDQGKFEPENVLADGENFVKELLLDGSTTYWFNLPSSCGGSYGNNNEITKDNCTNFVFVPTSGSVGNCRITTTAGGTYKFFLNTTNGQVKLSVEYPLSVGDYQIYYTDNTGKNNNYSNYIRKNTGSEAKDDIVSFYVKQGSSPTYQVKRCTGFDGSGNPTWGNVGDAQSISVTKDSVYNFTFRQPSGGESIALTGTPSYYSGNYYIRTDGAPGGWANYMSNPSNTMKNTDKASALAAGYNYYFVKWIGDADGNSTTNVKFVIANDYNNSLSQEMGNDPADGSLSGGQNLTRKGANVRFTYNTKTNEMTRTYIGGSAHDANYLVINGTNLKKSDGSAWAQTAMVDQNDWIYTLELKAASNATIQLQSHYNDKYVTVLPNETILVVNDAQYYDLRVIYDYKTNEVVAAYIPSTTVSKEMEVDVDIMFIRKAKDNFEDAPPTTLSLSGSGKITGAAKTLYGAIEFEKDYVRAEGEYIGLADKRPQRSTYWISFPFDVRVKDIFGLGDYTETWILRRYRGDLRAQKGWFLDTKTFWEYIMDVDYVLEAGQGYALSIDCEAIQWPNSRTTQYLYFPSKDKVTDITSVLPSADLSVPEHVCTITTPADRTIKDANWNVIGIPGFTTAWGYAEAEVETIGEGDFNYFYTWNPAGNTLSTTSARKYNFGFMHSYMVQYAGAIQWSASEPAGIVARRSTNTKPKEVEFCLSLQQNENDVDRTFVNLMDNEKVSAEFDMNKDLVKMFNSNMPNIYTLIGNDLEVAANCLPMSEQTTVVPVGVKIATTGDYTFSIPDGTNGVGVTLIDTETGVRTSLSALDYTINLSAGTYDNRFVLEISPIQQTVTDIEQSSIINDQSSIKKVMIDQILYIVKDGVMYDARGARVQ